MFIHPGQQNGAERQAAAQNDQKKTQKLISEITAVFFYSPGPVQRHFERLENSVGREQQQQHRCDLKTSVIDLREITDDEPAQVVREIIPQGKNKGLFRHWNMEHI